MKNSFQIRNLKDLSKGSRLLLDEMNGIIIKFGFYFGSDKHLAEKIGCSIRSIKRYLTEIEKKGYIHRETELYRIKNGQFRSRRKIFILNSSIAQELKKRVPRAKTVPHNNKLFLDREKSKNTKTIPLKEMTPEQENLLQKMTSHPQIILAGQQTLQNLVRHFPKEDIDTGIFSFLDDIERNIGKGDPLGGMKYPGAILYSKVRNVNQHRLWR